jgi:dTDP-glucose pyrophosphorylase
MKTQSWERHIISRQLSIREALEKLDALAADGLLFVHDSNHELIGSLTDGDIRRGLLAGYDLSDTVDAICQKHPRFIRENDLELHQLIAYRKQQLKIIPVLAADSNQIVDVINFRICRSKLPIDVVIMAGGEGLRLRPLTTTTPKPLLPVGGRPIVDYTLDRMAYFGVNCVWISVNYLADQMESFVKDHPKAIPVKTIRETEPLGTIGSISLVKKQLGNYVLVCNSDLLTDVDIEDFYLDFITSNADMSVVTIPYDVTIPYAVLEEENGQITSFKEKPTYTYYSNGGIYLIKTAMLEFIPEHTAFSAIDLMQVLMEKSKTIRSFHHRGYWLDIGQHEEYAKAQQDIHKLHLFS